MQIVDEVELEPAQARQPEVSQGWFARLERRKAAVIVCAVALAFGARVYDLDAAGLAEDETNKLFAIRCYEQGDFTANAEHPMVMKMLCFASMQVA
ncbi:MAG TPA: hypothetical protein VNO70_21415, partial [Blastocatellia bacterium]|nr:hypothetical protein [Blastocatellia bacterium]